MLIRDRNLQQIKTQAPSTDRDFLLSPLFNPRSLEIKELYRRTLRHHILHACI